MGRRELDLSDPAPAKRRSAISRIAKMGHTVDAALKTALGRGAAWPRWTLLTLTLLTVVAFFASFISLQRDIVFSPDSIKRGWGAYMYMVQVPSRGPLLVVRSDSNATPTRSRLVLFEDDRKLGPAHKLHAEIADEGAGRYSHLGRHIYFAASDNTDARENGRTYRAHVTYRLTPVVPLSAFLLTLVMGLLFLLANRHAMSAPDGIVARVNRFTLENWRSLTLERIAPYLAFGWPLVFLHRYLLGVWGGQDYSRTIGNDFLLYYVYKPYLLDLLTNFRLPGWSPAEGAGYSLIGSPLAQPVYPMNIPLALFYRAMGGFDAHDYHWYTVLHVSLFSLGLYLWLRALGHAGRVALFAALVFSVSFKLMDILRFPNAVCAAAWYPWLLLGATYCCRPEFGRRGWLLLAAAFFCIATAGYPYFLIYAGFLIVPFVLLLAFGPTRSLFLRELPADAPGPFRYTLTAGSALAVGSALALPWLLQVKAVLDYTTRRDVPSYEFATRHGYTPMKTLGAFVFPPASDPEGWVYFGMLTVFIMVAFFIRCFTKRAMPTKDIWLTVVLLAWIAIVTSITWGKDSVVFDIMWENVPFLQRMRYWGRLNIILVPLFALLFVYAWTYFERDLVERHRSRPNTVRELYENKSLLVTLTLIACIQWYLYVKQINFLWTDTSINQSVNAVWFCAMGLIALMAVWFLVHTGARGLWVGRPALLTGICFAIIVVDVWPEASMQFSRTYPTRYSERKILSVAETLEQGLEAPRINIYGPFLPEKFPSFNVANLGNWYSSAYFRFYKSYYDFWARPQENADPVEARAASRLLGMHDGKRLFLSKDLDYTLPSQFLADTQAVEAAGTTSMHVLHYDGDTLQLKVSTEEPMILSFIDNWLPGWKAQVNGNDTRIELLFGTFKAVRLTAGDNLVEFRYRPWTVFSLSELDK